jgi:hypothetical protein
VLVSKIGALAVIQMAFGTRSPTFLLWGMPLTVAGYLAESDWGILLVLSICDAMRSMHVLAGMWLH